MYKQELCVKDSYLKLHAQSQELPMKPDPICITKQKFIFQNEGERDLEKKRTDKIPYSNLCCVFFLCLMLLSLSCLSFFSSLYVFTLCVYFLSFCFFFSFFVSVCASLYLQRDSKEVVPLFFLSTDQIMEQFSSVFPPQLLISC